MKRLKANRHTLYVLCNAHPTLRKNMIKHVSSEVIKSIAEIAKNILLNNINLCRKKIQALKPYKTTIRKISEPHRRITSTRKLLVQRGGSVIPLLIGTVLSLLSNL